MLGISSIYVDLALTLIALSIASTIVAILPNINSSIKSYINSSIDIPPVRVIVVGIHTDKENLLVIGNPYNSCIGIVIATSNGYIKKVEVLPRSTVVVKLGSLDLSNIVILVNDSYVLRPEVINW